MVGWSRRRKWWGGLEGGSGGWIRRRKWWVGLEGVGWIRRGKWWGGSEFGVEISRNVTQLHIRTRLSARV